MQKRYPLFELPVQGLNSLQKSLRYITKAKLWLQVLIAMVLGIAFGALLSPEFGLVARGSALVLAEWIALPGQLFLALIQMIVVPLIFTSILQGVASAGSTENLKSSGLYAISFFLISTIFAVILGIGVGKAFRPGQFITLEEAVVQPQSKTIESEIDSQAKPSSPLKTLPSKVTALVPKNPMRSIAEGDMLQIVIFSIIFGLGLLMLNQKSAQPLLDLSSSIQAVSMNIVGLAMSFAPAAVFGLLAQSIIKIGLGSLAGLGAYASSVVGALFVLFIAYLLAASWLGKVKLSVFFKAARGPALIGFSTNSSAATMPVTVKAAEETLKVPTALSQFIIPLGATINMGGSACYQGLATLFMAQVYGLELGLGALVALVVTAVGASIGTPAVPGVGIIVLSGVLSSAGIPLDAIALILGADRILERFRTSLNVTGDLAACVVLNRLLKAPSTPKDA